MLYKDALMDKEDFQNYPENMTALPTEWKVDFIVLQ